MTALTITRDGYRDRVLGAWTGKSIGITLGASMRGQLIPGRFNYYSPVPGQPAASAAIDFPLVWLQTLEQTGPDLSPEDLAVAWLQYLDYQHDEFGYAALNLRRGLTPPSSGAHSNWFHNSTGGVMRADFWAMLLPGNPQAAAAYAYHDSKIDHSEEGIWAAMFVAAIGSAAFFIQDPLTLLTIGLAMIPRTCRTARAVKAALSAVQRGASWLESRESVQKEVGSSNITDVAQNMGFLTMGLFYGFGDFGGALCATINCGYDAEITGGALGAILGFQRGRSGLPEAWAAPLGDLVIPGIGLKGVKIPGTLTEVAARTAAIGEAMVASRSPEVSIVEFIPEPVIIEPEPEPDPTIDTTPEVVALSEDNEPAAEQEAALPIQASSPELAALLSPVELDLSEPAVRPLVPESAPTELAPLTPDLVEISPMPPAAIQPPALPETTPSLEPEADGAPQAVAEIPAPQPLSTLVPQAVSQNDLVDSSVQPQRISPTPAVAPVISRDPLSAIAWADSSLVKPLLVTPPHSFVSHAGGIESGIDVMLNMGDTATMAYNTPKTLVFTITNRASEPFSGKIMLLAPLGWQISGPATLGQRQYLAARTGSLRIEYTAHVNEGQGRIDIANALSLRLVPETGGPVLEAEFLILGAACWWTVGPFANYDGEGFDKIYGPEERTGLQESYVGRISNVTRWERHSFPESCMDLEAQFKTSSGVCYGQTNLNSRISREVRLVGNTNSGVKIWLNGVLVVRRMHREPFRPSLGSGPWTADVSLRAGDNPLMVKWVRSSEPYEFSLTISDRLGRGLPDVGNTNW